MNRPCSHCGTRKKSAKFARCAKHKTKHIGYHHAAIKGTGRYDSQYHAQDISAAAIDAILRREHLKKRPSWGLVCR